MQRGRKSAEGLAALVAANRDASRVTAPSGLTKAERTAFDRLVASCTPKHFVAGDVAMIVSFVQATRLARSAAHDPEKIGLWEKVVRLQASLATRLRLTPQSRTDPKTAGRMAADHYTGNPLPWDRDRDRPKPWE